MAINPSDFIFHSDLLYEQKITDVQAGVTISGDVAANSARSWSTEWQSIQNGATGVRGRVNIPAPFFPPEINSGSAWFQTPTEINVENPLPMIVTFRIEVQNNRYRGTVVARNPYGFNMSMPTKAITFKIATYMPQ